MLAKHQRSAAYQPNMKTMSKRFSPRLTLSFMFQLVFALRAATAAAEAFFARAERSSGVMVSSERFPDLSANFPTLCILLAEKLQNFGRKLFVRYELAAIFPT